MNKVQRVSRNTYGAVRLQRGIHTAFFLLLVGAIVAPFSAGAQWRSVGPEGGAVYSLAEVDSVLIVGTEAGLAISSDSGGSWQPLPMTASPHFPNGGPELAMLASVDTLILSDASGVATLANVNGFWNSVSSAGSHGGMLARSGSNVMSGSPMNGLIVSSDGGVTWLGVNQLMDTVGTEGGGTRIQFAAIHAIAASAGSFYVCSDRGIFTTQDNGLTWTFISPGPANSWVTTLLFVGDTVFASTSSKGVFVSLDLGVTWNSRSVGLSSFAINTLYGNNSEILATNRQGIDISRDNGATWSSVNNGLPGSNVNAVLEFAGNLFAATLDGVFCSTNGGSDWGESNKGLTIASVNAILRSNGTFFCSADGRPFLSTDDGITWERRDAGLSPGYVQRLRSILGVLFAETNYGIFRSNDSGTTWTTTPPRTRPMYITSIGGHLVGATRDTIFLSTDTGATWSVQSLLPADLWYSVYALGANSHNVYAGTYDEGPFLSTDEGVTWNPIPNWPSFPLHDQITSIVGDGSTMIIHTISYLYNSTDSGSTWIWDTSHALRNYYPNAFAVSGDTILAGGGGLFLSLDGGANWSDITSGLTYASIESVLLDGPNVIVGTYLGGAWRRPLNELLGVVETGRQTPPKTLACNPNPGAETEFISFTLATGSEVSLSIEDIAGRPIILRNAEYFATGEHTIVWDNRNFPAGTYLCRLTLPQSSETCKIVILK